MYKSSLSKKEKGDFFLIAPHLTRNITMSKLIKKNSWVWVGVLDPGRNEKFLGRHLEEEGISFIPIFLEKEEALQCLKHLNSDEEQIFEIQAIRYQDLARNAVENGFTLFILNGAGDILERTQP